MRFPTVTPSRLAALAVLLLGTSAAQAHTGHLGHDHTSLMQGLLHPISGADHLLAMFAVGLWSASALPAGKAWWGPATFIAALTASAALGMAGVALPQLELLIALSVVLFGVMLVLPRTALPVPAGLSLVALAASLHGLAHGAEAPLSGGLGYALGMLLTSAALHVSGLAAGQGVRRYAARHARPLLTSAGALLGAAGLYLAAQI